MYNKRFDAWTSETLLYRSYNMYLFIRYASAEIEITRLWPFMNFLRKTSSIVDLDYTYIALVRFIQNIYT